MRLKILFLMCILSAGTIDDWHESLVVLRKLVEDMVDVWAQEVTLDSKLLKAASSWTLRFDLLEPEQTRLVTQHATFLQEQIRQTCQILSEYGISPNMELSKFAQGRTPFTLEISQEVKKFKELSEQIPAWYEKASKLVGSSQNNSEVYLPNVEKFVNNKQFPKDATALLNELAILMVEEVITATPKSPADKFETIKAMHETLLMERQTESYNDSDKSLLIGKIHVILAKLVGYKIDPELSARIDNFLTGNKVEESDILKDIEELESLPNKHISSLLDQAKKWRRMAQDIGFDIKSPSFVLVSKFIESRGSKLPESLQELLNAIEELKDFKEKSEMQKLIRSK